jgi:chitin disaccharide deacetylase
MNYTLCADDYAYHQAVSDGILALLKAQKLNATSCMTNMPDWPRAAIKLKEIKEVQIGLHLNLTEGPALTPYFHPQTINQLILKSHCRLLNKSHILAEITAQLNAFKKHLGRFPDFIDGHQHVQQLPIVRDALLSVYAEAFQDAACKPWIRVSSNGFWRSLWQSRRCFKILVITLTGALTLKRRLNKRAIPYNTSFSGIYDFSLKPAYATQFSQFLTEIKPAGLIMCHPGLSASDESDAIARAREREYHYFA